MQVWRNRQTRMVQVHVSITLMQVQLLLPAPQKVYTQPGMHLLFLYVQVTGVEGERAKRGAQRRSERG